MPMRPDSSALAASLPAPAAAQGGADDDATASAQEVLDAIKANDASALASAMRALVASVSDS